MIRSNVPSSPLIEEVAAAIVRGHVLQRGKICNQFDRDDMHSGRDHPDKHPGSARLQYGQAQPDFGQFDHTTRRAVGVHADITVTLKVYSHCLPDDDANLAAGADTLFRAIG